MEVRRVTPQDIGTIQQWYVDRGIPAPNEALIPPTGYMVDDTAAIFMYRTDTAIALLEGTIANPAAPADDRNEAIDKVLEALEADAATSGVKILLGCSIHSGMSTRMLNRGWQMTSLSTNFTKEF